MVAFADVSRVRCVEARSRKRQLIFNARRGGAHPIAEQDDRRGEINFFVYTELSNEADCGVPVLG